MGKLQEKEFQQRIGKIDQLVKAIDQIGDASTQAKAKELVQLLLDLHGAGIERMLDIIYETGAAGQALIDELGRDELVGSLLLLHGLHPLDLESRVMMALEKVRPYLKSHGGNVELLGVSEEGVVRLRLQGSCHTCPSSRVTLKYAVEDAIFAAAPDVVAVEAEGGMEDQAIPQTGFIPMSRLVGLPTGLPTLAPVQPEGGGWVNVEDLGSLKEGALRTLDVSGMPVLFCRTDAGSGGSFYAYGNGCPNCGQLLGQAKLTGKQLVCATCGHHYDVMLAGRDLDDPRLHLDPFPLLEQHGKVKIALPELQT